MNQSNIESTEEGLFEKSSGRKIYSPLDMISYCEKVKNDTLSMSDTMEILGGPKYDLSASKKEMVKMCDELIDYLSNRTS